MPPERVRHVLSVVDCGVSLYLFDSKTTKNIFWNHFPFTQNFDQAMSPNVDFL